jgi:DHA1 family multidrug resistance protein-like MFS transporter
MSTEAGIDATLEIAGEMPPECPDWKRNLGVVWLAQFLSIMSFAFAIPFAPFYMQSELGISDPAAVKFWVAIFAAAAPLTLALFSPLWGMLADRVGRRPMLLRAYLGGAVILSLMGTARSVETLVLLRLCQGVFTGTITASQALVSAGTPKARGGAALGALSAAVFSGSMAGAFLGGWIAEFFGYRTAFYASGCLMLMAALLVLFGVRERFVRPSRQPAEPHPAPRDEAAPAVRSPFAIALPILLLMAAMAFTSSFDGAFLPLLVQEILGTVKGAALWTGSLQAVCGIAGILAGFSLGALADRSGPARIGQASAIGAGGFMLLTGMARWLPMLFAARFATVFCIGGLDPVFQVWLSRVTPDTCRGTVFGWAASAKSLGWMLAPLVGGAVAAAFGIRGVYLVGPALYLLLALLIAWVVRRMAANAASDAP